MTAPAPDFSAPDPPARHPSDSDLATEIRYLVASAEPAVVFSSLAKLCVPAFSDACTVDIVEYERAAYRIAYPLDCHEPIPAPSSVADETTVRTKVKAPGVMDTPGYSGLITYTWHSRRPGPTDVTQACLLARCAVLTVSVERLDADARSSRRTTEQLHAGVLTNRSIGVAMGIMMSTYHLTQDEAFRSLSLASERGERTMSDVAMDIINRISRPTRRGIRPAATRRGIGHPTRR